MAGRKEKLSREQLAQLWHADPTITASKLRVMVGCSMQKINRELEMAGISPDERKRRGYENRSAGLRRTMKGQRREKVDDGYVYIRKKHLRCPRCMIVTDDGELCSYCKSEGYSLPR